MAVSLHLFSVPPRNLHQSYLGGTASLSYAGTYTHAVSKINFVPGISSIRRHSGRPATFGLAGNVALSSEVEEEAEDRQKVQNRNISGSGGSSRFPSESKLFVGNLPFSVDSAALAEVFEKAGNVDMVEVIYDKFSGRSRGFGFVTMATPEEAEAAAQQFNGYELQGRELRVNSGPPPSKREGSGSGTSFRGTRGSERTSSDNTNRLHVSNLAWGVDNLALETLFSEQGNVKEARVIYDKESGRSRGFGFVTYSSPEEVTNAIEALDGMDLNGRSIRVSLAEARQTPRQYQ